MKWWKKLVEKWKKFIEETGKENDQMWEGKRPTCCVKDKD
jgi:hypothetical protein